MSVILIAWGYELAYILSQRASLGKIRNSTIIAIKSIAEQILRSPAAEKWRVFSDKHRKS